MATRRSRQSLSAPRREGNQRKRPASRPRSTSQLDKGARREAGATPPRAVYRRAPLASLRVFVAVAEHRSFTRGADALGLSTSAASIQVQSLEDYLRVPLFRRNGRHVE